MMLGNIPTMAERFRDQVVAAIKAKGWSMKDAARETGVSYDVIRELHRRPGSTTSAENARRLSRTLGLDGAQILAIDPQGVEASNVVLLGPEMQAAFVRSDDVHSDVRALIPVFDVQASAGTGLIPPEDEVVAYHLELPVSFLASLTDSNPKDLQVIGVKGISMLPTLKPGDLIIIDRIKTSLSYDGLFVLDVDDAILVKRVGRASRPGHVHVISDNKDQPSFERPVPEIKVIGKVVCLIVRQ